MPGIPVEMEALMAGMSPAEAYINVVHGLGDERPSDDVFTQVGILQFCIDRGPTEVLDRLRS